MATKLDMHNSALEQMLATFSSGGRQNVTLVGADGAGKTTVVAAFAEMLIDGYKGVPRHLLYQQVFMLDASSLVSSASGRGDLENLVTMIINEAYLSNMTLHLGLFFAIFMAIIIYIMIYKSKWGYEIKLLGESCSFNANL